ncbi:GCN5-like 1 [Penicillium malachiteum]|uniref:Biogenesis of lysosome-related organelles complex 1 subunit 1 n=1 Tax=Penicillium malachiteum TaxID=1324776 RepID=A0AAD6HGW3_9EURO|nr:GCN5-like 1 [Penicillium malachiteum]
MTYPQSASASAGPSNLNSTQGTLSLNRTATNPSTLPSNTERDEENTRQQEALAAFTATLHSVGTNLEAPLRERATIINSNAVSLERQEAELAGHSAKLARQNEGWGKIADETRAELKEIGDVQNWAEVIERDLLVLESMMDEVEGFGSQDEEEGEISGDEMDVDVDIDREIEQNGDVDGDVVMNGNGNANKDHDDASGRKKKRWSWFFWW